MFYKRRFKKRFIQENEENDIDLKPYEEEKNELPNGISFFNT